MNQPKFKFGDKVRWPLMEKVFIVKSITLSDCGSFLISDEPDEWSVNESEIEMYQGPQKKKLYAWASRDGVVFHVKSETVGPEVFYRIGIDAQGFKRSPDDDIEYPEKP